MPRPSRRLIVALAAAATLGAAAPRPSAAAPGDPAPDPARTRRLAWFREARFGLFIHYGLYAIPGGRWKGVDYPFIGEWIMKWAKIPAREYEGLARQFDPRRFDPTFIARLAREAGMKYLVITAKHHDGFALFDSRVTKYDVVDATPHRRDLLAPLAAAVAREGLKFGFYYSQAQDWHEANAAGNTWDFPTPHPQRKPDEYLTRKALPQVEELLTRYGPLGLIWFDTPTLLSEAQVRALEAMVRSKQPDCLINSRLGHGLGDYLQMGDNMVPSDVYPSVWEIPATLNDTWGFKPGDGHWKSTGYLLYRLVDVVSKGGNYLLNVGPAPDGSIPPESVQRLREIGRWMERHAESIHGTEHSPFSVGDDAGWRATTRPGVLYVHLLRWPAGGRFQLDGLRTRVAGASLLSDPQRAPLAVQQDGSRLTVTLPGDAPDPYIPVLALRLAEGTTTPEVDPALRWDAPRARVTLPARDASPHGPHIRYSEFDGTASGFREKGDTLNWHFLARRPGKHQVEVEYAAAAGEAGDEVVVSAFGQEVKARLAATDGAFRWLRMGTLEVRGAAPALEQTRLRLPEPRRSVSVRVRALRLTAVGPAAGTPRTAAAR